MLFEKSGGAVDWLIVGLGNPGQKYEHTRHNMGFLTVDLLAEKLNVKLNKVKFKSAYNISLSFLLLCEDERGSDYSGKRKNFCKDRKKEMQLPPP